MRTKLNLCERQAPTGGSSLLKFRHSSLVTRHSVLSFALCSLLLASSFPTHAQQANKIPRIAIVGSGDPQPELDGLRQGLRDLGYVEGTNILIKNHFVGAKRSRLPSLVAELVQSKIDVLIPVTVPAMRAVKKATRTIPIVMVSAVDPVAIGMVDSLARPGGNITGLSRLMRELSGKRLELLAEVVPELSRIAVLWEPDRSGPATGFKDYRAAAHALKLELQSLPVRSTTPDLDRLFDVAVNAGVGAIITIRSREPLRYRKQIANLAIKNRLASMHEAVDFVEAGGLMYYGPNGAELFRRAATFVDKILKGKKPAELPVEQPTTFEFIVNLKTAKQIGLTIPPNVLARADKVIR